MYTASLFSTSLVMISIEVGYQCFFTNIMDNSVSHRDRELQLNDLHLLMILEMRSSSALESAAYLCLFS